MPILLTVLLNYSGKEQNSNGPRNAIMLSTSLRRNYAKCHLYNTQTPTKLFKWFTDASNYSYSGILHQAQDEEPDELIPIAYFSTRHSNFGMSPRKNAMLCIGQLINFYFTLHEKSASYIVIISHWLHS